MNSNSIGQIQRNSFAPAIIISPADKTSSPHQYASAMDVDLEPNQPVHQSRLSGQDSFIKRKRAQRKLDVQIDSRQALLDKTEKANQLRQQQATNRIGKEEFVQAMEALKKLRIKY